MTKRNILFLIIILSLSLFLRTFLIGAIPPSLSNDEVDYVYDAYSIAQTGKDVLGKRLPLSFVTDQKMSPVPVYFTALFLRFLPLNTFTARLPFAIVGVLTVLLVYFLTKELFSSPIPQPRRLKKKPPRFSLATITSLLLAISPWHLQLSRVAYDANFALLFYLLAMLLFLKEKLLLSLLPFLLAYYSYHGTKILFLPLIAVLIWYKLDFLKKNKRRLFSFLGLILIIFFSFYFVGNNQQGIERVDQILFLERKESAEFVNYERRTSQAPQIIKKIFNNKPLYYFRTIKERYFAYFNFLFNSGEESGLYSLWFRGNQYFIELFFVILGLYYLFQHQRKTAIFLSILLFVSVFPSAFSVGKSSFGTRALVGLPFLIIIIAWGIIRFNSIKIKRAKFFLPAIVVFLYLCSFASYLHQYYFRYPIYGAESWYFSEQKAIDYLIKQQKIGRKIIFTHYHFPVLMRYAISNQVEPKKIQQVAKLKGDIVFDNVKFLEGCPNKGKGNPFDFLSENSVLVTKWDWDCYKDIKATKEIRAQDDNRVMWRIYEKDINSNS